MIRIMAIIGFVLVLVVPVRAADQVVDPLNIVATWSVTRVRTFTNCETESGAKENQQWQVDAMADGGYKVTISGDTSFKNPSGSIADGILVLSQVSSSAISSTWRLKLTDGMLVGTQTIASRTTKSALLCKNGGSTECPTSTACFTEFAVTATRIGAAAAVPF